ncbi:hypothetical protein MCETHM1_00485 [Flavobacteriaceae bacterium]
MKKSVIEKQIKEKLATREFTPSPSSWDRLDAMLAVTEKPKRNFKWVYFAASVLGFLLISTLYFNQNQEEIAIPKNDIVVNEPKIVPEKKNNSTPQYISKKIMVKSIVLESYKVEKKSNESNSSYVSTKIEKQVVQTEETQEQQIPIIYQIISQKAEQQVVLRKSKYVNVDELLASVDPLSKKKNSSILQSTVKVNSNELLSQVDGELELSFREKALKVVNQKIKTVTVALSNRNSE